MANLWRDAEKEPIDILKSNLKAIEGFIKEDSAKKISLLYDIEQLNKGIENYHNRCDRIREAIIKLEGE